jgi:molecular chaperone GrpE
MSYYSSRAIDEGAAAYMEDPEESLNENGGSCEKVPSKNEQKKAISEMQQRISVLEDKWKRTSAELENSRRRLTRDYERQRTMDREALLRHWLPVVDNLERALKTGSGIGNPWYEGMRAIYNQMIDVLKTFNVTAFNPKGEQFDPNLHEAVAAVNPSSDGFMKDGSTADGGVADVLLTGYTIGDGESSRVLRPAKVAVVKKRG